MKGAYGAIPATLEQRDSAIANPVCIALSPYTPVLYERTPFLAEVRYMKSLNEGYRSFPPSILCRNSLAISGYASERTEEEENVELPPSPTLINRNAQTLAYVGVILFLVGTIAAIGLVSRKIAFATIFAFMLGLAIAIVFLPL
ncbi:MAG: hypothetical protein SVX43_08365 [Cyanobacteriota bacterium]|nr:hypothetical protein [Cyanobacteriota bacterium]